MTSIEQLVAQGYRPEEAEALAPLVAKANAEQHAATRTGRCRCGGKLARSGARLDCGVCDMAFQAA